MPIKRRKISELEEAKDLTGFFTIGYRILNGAKKSVKYGLGYIYATYLDMLQAIKDLRGLEATVEENEEERETAEGQRKASEQSRQTAETARGTAETARKNAETGRVNAESARVTAEGKRVTAESSRVTAENNRVSAENTRVSQENARKTAETGRVEAEKSRVTEEGKRVASETGRVNAESARVTAEGKRVTAESSRVTAENNRVSAENTRVSQENARKTAETGRVEAEKKRVTAETERVNAESTRVTEEGKRVTAESSRVTAETSRVNAEKGRVTAETGRVNAEKTRVTAETERVGAETTRVTEFATIKQNAEAATKNANDAADKANKAADGISAALDKKVDKVSGKGLSTNDYTTAEKTKLSGIAVNANNYTHPSATAYASGLYKIITNNQGHVTSATKVVKADITGLGIPAQDTVYTHPDFTARSSGLYKVTVNNQGHVTDVVAVTKADITGLGIPAQDTVYVLPKAATDKLGGLMIGYAASGKNYAVQLDAAGKAFVNVPWTDTNTTYAVATTSANGLMAAAMVTKLNGIASGANNYIHPTTSGNKHIPSGGKSGQILKWSADGTAVWGTESSATQASSSTFGVVKIGTAAAKAPGTASPGSTSGGLAASVDHVHPAQTTISGNAGTATKLQTARKINTIDFDGTKDIRIPCWNVGEKNASDSHNTYPVWLSMSQALGANGWPVSYGNVLTMRGLGDTQIVVEWSASQTEPGQKLGMNMFIRGRRDIISGWSEFIRVITEGSDFSGRNIGLSGYITSSGYVYSETGWFQNNRADVGLYNQATDTRWYSRSSDSGKWYADKGAYFDGTVWSHGFFKASDIRLKSDVKPLSHTLEQIISIPTSSFIMDGNRQIGSIAQEIEPDFPEIVSNIIKRKTEVPEADDWDTFTTEENGEIVEYVKVKTVEYEMLSVLALEGLKLLNRKVEDLKKQLNVK